jgi:O2-independent ubiquinone biosynthesis protein UbiV
VNVSLLNTGKTSFRLWPHDIDMVAVAALHRAVLDGHQGMEAATAQLAEIAGFAPFANGFYHGKEGAISLATAG